MIPVAAPSITEREGELAREAALNAWGPDHYAFNSRFEEMFARYIGVKHAVSLPHATSALHLALAANGIGPGDEIIVPDVTWIASTAPISYVGAAPVFVDILPDTWCIDPMAVKAAITPKTKAIIGVDLYGSMCDWPSLKLIAEQHNIVLIEDAAEALGSSLNGLRAGRFGNAAAFSFHGSKTVVTGEGGMLVTDDTQLHAHVLHLRDHGRTPGDRQFQNSSVAFKYKMSAMQAAVGIAQMERIDELIAYKRKLFEWYRSRLSEIAHITFNAEPDGVFNSYWMVTIVPTYVDGPDKFVLQERLRQKGVDTRPFFSRLSELKAYENTPESARFLPAITQGAHTARFGINLPSGYGLKESDVEFVCEALKQSLI